MEGLRRSSRNTKKMDYDDKFTPSYPENQPRNEFEHRIALLNKQTFISSSFAAVDDALVYALFSSKRRTTGHRAMIPDRAFREEEPLITKEQGLTICHIYKNCLGEQGKGHDENFVEVACDSMSMALPDVFTRERLPILRQ